MAETDDRAWLYRLDATQWVAAARNELDRAYPALRGKHHRPGLAYARRAAGMAINALLVQRFDARYGRSYMDHLKALTGDDTAPAAVREAARVLLKTPIQQPEVVQLAKQGSVALADAARAIVEHAAEMAQRGEN